MYKLCTKYDKESKSCKIDGARCETRKGKDCPLDFEIKVAVDKEVRSYNVGGSDYSKHKIQPWDIWEEYKLNPWDADIIKRVLRNKKGEDRITEYKKIIHIAKERIRQLTEK